MQTVEKYTRHPIIVRHWPQFVQQVVVGNLDNQAIFLDLIQVLTVQAGWQLQRNGLQNMKYPPAFDDWCHELLCICPKAYCLFCKQFAGQSKRSFLEKWSACPNSFQVISPQVLQCAHKYLEDYNYPGEALLALSIDDTKLLPAFQPYFDHRAGKWFLVGNAGKPLEVQDIDKHADQIDCAWELLTTKLWLWVLQIPLCCVPPLILAVIPHASSMDATSLAAMEQWLLKVLIASKNPLCIVSLGSDSSIVEHDASWALVWNDFAEQMTYLIPHPEGPWFEDIHIQILCVCGQHITIIQDPKHCCKTGCKNLFSGTQLLVLENHTTY